MLTLMNDISLPVTDQGNMAVSLLFTRQMSPHGVPIDSDYLDKTGKVMPRLMNDLYDEAKASKVSQMLSSHCQ